MAILLADVGHLTSSEKQETYKEKQVKSLIPPKLL